ncbi:MAG TPA: hypothetical protein VGI40_27180 [Pirellulaceae bacterium]|jgi:hypothetical protein
MTQRTIRRGLRPLADALALAIRRTVPSTPWAAWDRIATAIGVTPMEREALRAQYVAATRRWRLPR